MENNNTEIVGIVAYCDGGASPNPGPTICIATTRRAMRSRPLHRDGQRGYGSERTGQAKASRDGRDHRTRPLGVGTRAAAVVTLFEHDWLDTANKPVTVS